MQVCVDMTYVLQLLSRFFGFCMGLRRLYVGLDRCYIGCMELVSVCILFVYLCRSYT